MTAFGKSLLQSVGREDMQDFLESKARDCSTSIVRHLRWFLNAIFKLAVSDGMIGANPAAELRIPRHCRPGREMRPMDEQQVQAYLTALDLRERLIARFAIFEGMRPGEILALRWPNIRGDRLSVEQRVYRRKFDSPKNGKSRDGAVSPGTLALLNEWRRLCADCEGGFVFSSENAAMPISLDNLWRRSMKPKLDVVGLGWATFQVLRKTNATLSKKHGVDPKVAADQRGHGIGVSMQVYTSSDLEQKREAVRKLDEALRPSPIAPSKIGRRRAA
jgi:integrase